MVKVQEVVNLWLMELSWDTESASTNCTSALLGNTSSVEANVIDVVLLSLLLKLSKADLSVASRGRSGRWYVT